MTRRIGAAERECFTRDGFLFPVQVMEPDEAHAHLLRLEAMESARAGRLPALYNVKPHLLVRALWDLVHDCRVVDCVESLIGPDIVCWGSTFLTKSPGDGRHTSWHQDAPYYEISSQKAVTAWIALTPSTAGNGCLRMIAGSGQNEVAHETQTNVLGRNQKVICDIDEHNAVDVILSAGQMSLHDSLVVHCSKQNWSAERRVGFVVRYMPSAFQHRSSARASATLVRGRSSGAFDLETAPESDFDHDAVARHGNIVRQARAVVSDGYFLGLLKTRNPADASPMRINDQREI